MNRLKTEINPRKGIQSLETFGIYDWPSQECEGSEVSLLTSGSFPFSSPIRGIGRVGGKYDENWAESVPELIVQLVSLVELKKKQELQFNLLQITANDFERRIHRLESIQTQVIPVGSFAPEPYNLLKTILVSVHCVEGGFNAGWFDANIHTSGDNEEEAISNLKSLILDFFDRFSSEPADLLGPEPARQLAVLKEYILKKP